MESYSLIIQSNGKTGYIMTVMQVYKNETLAIIKRDTEETFSFDMHVIFNTYKILDIHILPDASRLLMNNIPERKSNCDKVFLDNNLQQAYNKWKRELEKKGYREISIVDLSNLWFDNDDPENKK